jgi:hypothetical protein
MEQTSNVDGAAGYVQHPQSHPRKAEDYGLRDSLAEAVMARSRERYRVDSRGAISRRFRPVIDRESYGSG